MCSIVINRQLENLRIIERYDLFNDLFMSAVFCDKACAALLLNIIFERDDIQITDVRIQYAMRNIYGKSVYLDVFMTDADGICYDVEIQKSHAGAKARRTRGYRSLIDANVQRPGKYFDALPDLYVIFITETDVRGDGKSLYHMSQRNSETGEEFDDGSHVIYVNGENEEETALGRLMHDFHCTNSNDMYYDVLAKRVRYLKEETEGHEYMEDLINEILERECLKSMEIGRLEGIEFGRREGHQEGQQKTFLKIIQNMITDGFTNEMISKYTGLSHSELKDLMQK